MAPLERVRCLVYGREGRAVGGTQAERRCFLSRPRRADAPFARASPTAFHSTHRFRLVITSQFHMDNFRQFLRSKLPLHWMQPVQYCDTLLDVCKVLENGLPADNSDDVFDEMERLANAL